MYLFVPLVSIYLYLSLNYFRISLSVHFLISFLSSVSLSPRIHLSISISLYLSSSFSLYIFPSLSLSLCHFLFVYFPISFSLFLSVYFHISFLTVSFFLSLSISFSFTVFLMGRVQTEMREERFGTKPKLNKQQDWPT